MRFDRCRFAVDRPIQEDWAMRTVGAVVVAWLWLVSPCVWAEPSNSDPRDDQVIKTARSDRSAVRVILTYIPNRIFDVLDIVRLRARVGPGIAARVRATEVLDAGLGSYVSLFAGPRGPRQEVRIPWPMGVESFTGIELVGDAEVESRTNPHYSSTEFGASIHALLIGLDIGVDPFEVVDLVAGLVFIDLRADDF
jgi:hypothetical protein